MIVRAEPPSVSRILSLAVTSELLLVQRNERDDPEEVEHVRSADALDSTRLVWPTCIVTFETDSVEEDEDVGVQMFIVDKQWRNIFILNNKHCI